MLAVAGTKRKRILRKEKGRELPIGPVLEGVLVSWLENFG